MKNIVLFSITALLLGIFLIGCAPKSQDLSQEINVGIIGTLAARPISATPTLQPFPTPFPTPEISGLFCEYSFCVGHPTDLPFFDIISEKNPAQHSSYGSGKVAGFRDNLFIIFAWVQSTGTWDAQGLMKVMSEEFGDLQPGEMKIDLIGDLNVAQQPVKGPASSIFTSGTLASWRCADRDFVWLAFSVTDGETPLLLADALRKFKCLQ
jgi:hypothetical protein